MNNIIYGLVDPRTLLVRYVGKSVSGLARPRGHRCPSNLEASTHKNAWIKSLRVSGLDYEIAVLEETSRDALADTERFWIAYGRACDWPLTNLTDGGEGRPGYVMSDETRAKLIIARRARPGEVTARVTAALREPAVRAKIAKALTGITRSPETRAKMAAAARLRTHTLESRAKISASKLGKQLSPEHAAKVRVTNLGKKFSTETRAKMSTAARRASARRSAAL